MLIISETSQFKKDKKRAIRRGKDLHKLEKVIELLQNEQPLPDKYKNHILSGDYAGFSECHIEPDWLLIYIIDNEKLILVIARTGTHADLF